MLSNGDYQMDLVRRLSFNRLGGSPEELRAAHILQEEIDSLGGTSRLEPFMMPWYRVHRCAVEVTAPFTRTLEASEWAFSGSTPEEGIEAPLLYAEQGTPLDLCRAGGKIVLLNEMVYDNWPALLRSGALAFITTAGEYDEDPAQVDLAKNHIRPHQAFFGRIPGVIIRGRDAIALLQDGAERVRLTLTEDDFERESHNVTAEIPGSDRAGEIIVLTAHYDSVPFSRGSWDNASGSADLMMLYRYFLLEHRPRRTLRFVWCGSEERGLLGSRAYVEAHRGELSAYRLCINLDMTGTTLGYDLAHVTADASAVTALEYLSRELEHPLTVRNDVHSSDSTSFADAGVPAVSFCRPGRAAYHCRRDSAAPLSAKAFARTQDFLRAFASRLDASSVFPIPRDIPQDIRDAVDRYFRRDKMKA